MAFLKKTYRRFLALLTLLTLELVLIWIIFLGSLFVFAIIWNEVFYLEDYETDEKVFNFLSNFTNPENTFFWKAITFLGGGKFLVFAGSITALYFLVLKKHHWYSLKIPVVAAGSLTLNLILKYIFSRPRPMLPLTEATGYSFPSGHAMVAFSFYGLLIYLSWINIENKILRYGICTFLLLLIILIGFSRIYLRVHYTSDVIAGFAMGIFWLVLSLYILKKIERYSKNEFDPVVKRD